MMYEFVATEISDPSYIGLCPDCGARMHDTPGGWCCLPCAMSDPASSPLACPDCQGDGALRGQSCDDHGAGYPVDRWCAACQGSGDRSEIAPKTP